MSPAIGIRHETKSSWERRSPLTPRIVQHLVKEKELDVLVQASARRVFNDTDYVRAGARVTSDLAPAHVVFGVKEIPPNLIEPGTTYVFFSHVIKGQSYNMPMLTQLLEQGCTLIDYELIREESGRRLIFFGRFAGLSGMIDSLWTLGQRLQWEGIQTPFSAIQCAHAYDDLDQAKNAISAAGEAIAAQGLPEGLAPLIIGVAGYGNVASGVREILSELPTEEIAPEEIAAVAASKNPSRSRLYQVTFREEHLVKARAADHEFDLQEYYQQPELYQSCFAPHLEHLAVLMNCTYWDQRYPRLVTKEWVAEHFLSTSSPQLRVIGDLGCDVEGTIECTMRCTDPSQPVYVFDPQTGGIEPGVSGRGPVVLAVDILPTELPRDSSEAFSETLAPFVAPIARADYGLPFAELDLPAEILRAVIVHRGELTPDYKHLAQYLDQDSPG